MNVPLFQKSQMAVKIAPYVQLICDGSESRLEQCGMRLGLETSDDCFKCHTEIL
jgi:hypothetical protein